MCTTCGCSDNAKATVTTRSGDMVEVDAHEHHHAHDHTHGHAHPHAHPHEHDHAHAHAHPHEHDHTHAHAHEHHPYDSVAAHAHATTVSLEQEVLAKNNRLAERNRGWLEGRNILALNLVSSPGAGKTTLLERTIRDLRAELPVSVIEGDQETLNDAERIRATGCDVVQINTGTGCHLEADMLARGLRELDPEMDSVVMIENVGNLVCPALFDLGERAKVVILSVTEGEDKPIKYPHMFRAAQAMVLNKIDLLAYVDFDVERCIEYARTVNPRLQVFQVSATRGQGLETWYDWLSQQVGTPAVKQSEPHLPEVPSPRGRGLGRGKEKSSHNPAR